MYANDGILYAGARGLQWEKTREGGAASGVGQLWAGTVRQAGAAGRLTKFATLEEIFLVIPADGQFAFAG